MEPIDPIEILKQVTHQVELEPKSNQRRFALRLLSNVRLYLEDPKMYRRFQRGISMVEYLGCPSGKGGRGTKRRL